MKTKHLVRSLIRKAVAAQGYRISGNHIFSSEQWSRVNQGKMAHGVDERPNLYPFRIARFAHLLQATYY